jgi:hypothetical protein
MCHSSLTVPNFGTDDAVGGAASTKISNRTKKLEKRLMAREKKCKSTLIS